MLVFRGVDVAAEFVSREPKLRFQANVSCIDFGHAAFTVAKEPLSGKRVVPCPTSAEEYDPYAIDAPAGAQIITD